MTISVVVPTFRRGAYLGRTLSSLWRQRVSASEILVVDQTALQDYETQDLEFLRRAETEGKIRWIRLPEPAVSKARNRAILESRSEILLYLDDDIEPSKYLLERHLRHYEDPSVHGVVGSVLLPTDQAFVPVPLQFCRRSPVEQAFTYCERFDRPLSAVGFMYAGNFSVRRGTLVSVGGWDEHVLNYGDRDLGLRLAQRGYRIDYDPEASIVHFRAPSGGTRVTDLRSPWRGWQRCVSIHYIALRHLSGWMFLRYGLYRAARFSFLLKQNVVRPWRLPAEVWAFVKAFIVATRWANERLLSPFSTPAGRLPSRDVGCDSRGS